AQMAELGLTSEMERNVDRSYTFGMQEITLPPGSLVFTEGPDTGTPIPSNANRLLVPTQQIKWRRADAPAPNADEYDSVVGRVDVSPFDGPRGWKCYAAESLLFLPVQLQRSRTITGRISWDVLLVASYRPQGWNKFPNARGKFYAAAAKNGEKLFQS